MSLIASLIVSNVALGRNIVAFLGSCRRRRVIKQNKRAMKRLVQFKSGGVRRPNPGHVIG